MKNGSRQRVGMRESDSTERPAKGAGQGLLGLAMWRLLDLRRAAFSPDGRSIHTGGREVGEKA